MRRLAPFALILGLLGLLWPAPAAAQDLDVEEIVLDNGMKVLCVPRREAPRVFCAVMFKVGGVDEHPGITGISHLLEHMLFKGTEVMGTTDPEADAAYIEEIDRVWDELLAIQAEERALARHGEELPSDVAERRETLRELYEALLAAQRDTIVKDDLWETYMANGGTFLNASTGQDSTQYFVTLPSNRVELFFWLESDRMLNPVFREFYSERDVVMEERRLRTDSTPTGRTREAFRAMFWQAHPYGLPVIGWMSDLRSLTREDAVDHFETYYAPNNAVAILVGDVDTDEIEEMARRYFGRLARGPEVPAVRTMEPEQVATRRMRATADADDSLRIQVHAVPAGHPDQYPLDVLAGVLSGRTGRLHRALVEGDDAVALEVSAWQSNQQYGGSVALSARPTPEADHAAVEEALLAEVRGLAEDPPSETEMAKVKNQAEARLVRALRRNIGVAFTLGRSELFGTPDPATELDRLRAVTAEDVARVAREYFEPERLNILEIHRREADEADGPSTADAAPSGETAGTASDGEEPELDAEQRAFEQQIRRGMSQLRAQWDRLRQGEMGPRILQRIRENMDRIESPDLRAEVEELVRELEADLESREGDS